MKTATAAPLAAGTGSRISILPRLCVILLLAAALSGCGREAADGARGVEGAGGVYGGVNDRGDREDYSRFSGAVNRVYIEDGAGGTILFTPHGDGPPIKNVTVYRDEEFVYLTIRNRWAEIYVPGHRTRYVLPSERIVRIDRIIPKEESDAVKESFSRRISPGH